MLYKLENQVFVDAVVSGELHRKLQHVSTEEGHPRRAVRLLEVAAGRKRRTPIEDADVIEAEEPALEDILAEAVLAVLPLRLTIFHGVRLLFLELISLSNHGYTNNTFNNTCKSSVIAHIHLSPRDRGLDSLVRCQVTPPS